MDLPNTEKLLESFYTPFALDAYPLPLENIFFFIQKALIMQGIKRLSNSINLGEMLVLFSQSFAEKL